MKKILIVEDNSDYQENWADLLAPADILIFSASNLADAERLFNAHPEIDLIVMDACVDHDAIPDSLNLVRRMRETFEGPIVAASGLPEYRTKLIEVGCDYESKKEAVPKKVREILGI